MFIWNELNRFKLYFVIDTNNFKLPFTIYFFSEVKLAGMNHMIN